MSAAEANQLLSLFVGSISAICFIFGVSYLR